MQHVKAFFATREAADVATEHLVQEHGIERLDIFLQPVGSENSEGLAPSGGDAAAGSRGTRTRTDGALGANIELSVDVDEDRVPEVREVLERAGANVRG